MEENEKIGVRLAKCLKSCDIPVREYQSIMEALYLIKPKHKSRHQSELLDSTGLSCSQSRIVRVFESAKVIVEDRGSVYHVWVKRDAEVLFYAKFCWPRLYVLEHTPIDESENEKRKGKRKRSGIGDGKE
jgi:hypothetical protein